MRRLLAAMLLAATLLEPAAAVADARTAQAIEQLKSSDDYRVRTQAALTLGSSGEDVAVKPLCAALAADSNQSVKLAAAAALGKLGKPAALPCLKAASARESGALKGQIDKSIAGIGSPGSSGGGAPAPADPPAPAADAKYYVAIQVTNKTGRSGPEVENLVRGALQDKLLAGKGYAVAPKGESTAAGGQIVKSKKLKGFLLIATVDPPAYAGGDLTMMVRVSMWTYPDKTLQGEVAPKMTQESTSKGDTRSENELMKMCAESAVDNFKKVAASL